MNYEIKIPTMFLPDITENHINKMLHAVGLDNQSPRKYRDRFFYYPYRNHYDAGGTDKETWEFLVEKGYANRSGSGMYHVSLLGLNILSICTGIQVYSENAKYDADTKRAVLKFYIDQDVYCGYGCWTPTPSNFAAARLRIPRHKVLKAIHELVGEGYLFRGSYGELTDDGFPVCVHGFYATDKVKEIPYYKTAYEREMDYINNMIKGDGENEV